MLPAQLNASHFVHYPPQARGLALQHLSVLQEAPLSFLPAVLREMIEYDYAFPAERAAMERDLGQLEVLSPKERAEWFSGFSRLHLSAALDQFDWVNLPLQFTEQLSAYLWSTNQMDAFRTAATVYGDRMRAATAPETHPARRVGVAVIGQGVTTHEGQLFEKLRAHGTYFSNIRPEGGLAELLAAAGSRAQAHPSPYGHWYIEGGSPADHPSPLTCVSYERLRATREALLGQIQDQVSKPGMGPEALRSYLTKLSPAQLGLQGDVVLDRFQVKLLTEGSGTQIFSTTFAQWAAREVLRRADPLTVLVRFAPRQRQRPMSDLLSSDGGTLDLDPKGSLIDADMAAYYHWINQNRLPGAEQSSFLAWFEGHSQAVAIGPALPRGTKSDSPLTVKNLISLVFG